MVKSLANTNFNLPIQTASHALSHGTCLQLHFLFFSSAPAFGCCSCWSSPYQQEATHPFQVGTGLNRPWSKPREQLPCKGQLCRPQDSTFLWKLGT